VKFPRATRQLEWPSREGVRGPGPDRELGQGRRLAERSHSGSEGQAPGRALHGAAQLHREQRECVDRLRPALPSWQADLDLTGREHRQSAGERTHEQATADTLVAPRRPAYASGQGRSAGRTLWPPSTPARGIAPQVFDTPLGELERPSGAQRAGKRSREAPGTFRRLLDSMGVTITERASEGRGSRIERDLDRLEPSGLEAAPLRQNRERAQTAARDAHCLDNQPRQHHSGGHRQRTATL